MPKESIISLGGVLGTAIYLILSYLGYKSWILNSFEFLFIGMCLYGVVRILRIWIRDGKSV